MAAGRRALIVVASCLPILLIAHAIVFWGRGIIDQEAMAFVVNYLADRPFAGIIFDPRLNDWELYQARELSYVFDFIDARVFASLLDRRILLFVPVSGVAGLIAASGIYLWGARRVLRLDGMTASLLLSLFLSCVVTQASTAILYRSSKITLVVALFAFLFTLSSMLAERDGSDRPSVRRLMALGLLGLVMSLLDRQGFYFLVVATVIVVALLVPARAGGADVRRDRRWIVLVGAGAAGLASLYNNVVGPWIIHALNGYWPSFDYQRLPFEDLDAPLLASQAWAMLSAQVSLFFGSLPAVPVGVAAAAACVVLAWRRRSAAPVLIALSIGASLFLLLGVMILRHRSVFLIPDHAFWYYTLTIHAVLLFGTTLLVAGLGTPRSLAGRAAGVVLVGLLIGNNIRHYPDQRAIMVDSGDWFKNQYDHSRRFAEQFDQLRAARPKGERELVPWLSLGPAGAVVDLPFGNQAFLHGVEIAYASLKGRLPKDAGGDGAWAALRSLLTTGASPLNDPDQIGAVLDGLRRMGVHQVIVNGDRYDDAELGRATMEGAAIAPAVLGAARNGGSLRLELKPPPAGPAASEPVRAIPRTAMAVTVSAAADRVPFLFDLDPDTRWLTGQWQSGNEWVRIEFDAPRDVARIRLDTAERSFGDFPRHLVIRTIDAHTTRTVYDEAPLGAMIAGLMRDSVRAPIEIDLPPGPIKTLVLNQTGRGRAWWSIHELTIFEREP